MDTGKIRRVMALNAQLEEAEARRATCAWRVVELMNKRCRNEAARVRFLKRTEEDLMNIVIEIRDIEARLEAARA